MRGVPIEITIGGKAYRLAVPEGQEGRVKSLAARVDAIVNDMRDSDPAMDRDRVLMLSLLQLAGDLASTQMEIDTQTAATTSFHRDLATQLERLLPR
jgi:cell division protein ZapA (FtsZ GTPase activity inhibitor)